jgi:hypothetical protein
LAEEASTTAVASVALALTFEQLELEEIGAFGGLVGISREPLVEGFPESALTADTTWYGNFSNRSQAFKPQPVLLSSLL